MSVNKGRKTQLTPVCWVIVTGAQRAEVFVQGGGRKVIMRQISGSEQSKYYVGGVAAGWKARSKLKFCVCISTPYSQTLFAHAPLQEMKHFEATYFFFS